MSLGVITATKQNAALDQWNIIPNNRLNSIATGFGALPNFYRRPISGGPLTSGLCSVYHFINPILNNPGKLVFYAIEFFNLNFSGNGTTPYFPVPGTQILTYGALIDNDTGITASYSASQNGISLNNTTGPVSNFRKTIFLLGY
jgi:hypothetical protein